MKVWLSQWVSEWLIEWVCDWSVSREACTSKKFAFSSKNVRLHQCIDLYSGHVCQYLFYYEVKKLLLGRVRNLWHLISDRYPVSCTYKMSKDEHTPQFILSSARDNTCRLRSHGSLCKGQIEILRNKKQAGAELGQAQLKLGLDFTLIFCRLVSLNLVW